MANNVVFTDTDEKLQDCHRSIDSSWRVGVDLETTGLFAKKHEILLIQLCGDIDGVSYVIPRQRVDQQMLLRIMRLLPDKVCLGHNLVFEWMFIHEHFNGLRLDKLFDTMLADCILTAGLEQYKRRHKLDDVADRYLGVALDKSVRTAFIGADASTWAPTPEQIAYAAQDVAILHKIRALQVNELLAQDLMPTALLEFSCVPVFALIQLNGMLLDTDKHATVIAECQADVDRYGKEAIAALTPHSRRAQAKQMAEATVLFSATDAKIKALLQPYGGKLHKTTPDDVRLEVEALRKVRDKQKPKPARELRLSSREMVLAALREAGVELDDLTAETVAEHQGEHAALEAYARWKAAEKIVSTYGQPLADRVSPVTGRVHGEYQQIVSTGRTSSSNPNMQNLPLAIRTCFRPREGYKYVIADYEGMELRVAAALAGDVVMLEAFAQGKDLHAMTAAAAWPEYYADWTAVSKHHAHRALAKTANFSTIYGGSAMSLFYRGVVDDKETAERVVNGIYQAYPTMTRWMRDQGARGLAIGYAQTALGRRRYFNRLPPHPLDYDARKKWYAERNGIIRAAQNMPVQGTAADIAKRAMALMLQRLPAEAQICAMVHDEILVECPSDMTEAVSEIVRRCMEEAGAEMLEGVATTVEIHIKDLWAK